MTASERTPKIYTRTGDKGKTSLIGGARVSKADLRLEAYGTLDELNSILGVLKYEVSNDLAHSGATDGLSALETDLAMIQSNLFNLGSQLACEDPKMRSQLPGISKDDAAVLENRMDSFTANLKPLKNFILPGGARSASVAHVARSVCRRAERCCVALNEVDATIDPLIIAYVNRLSDYFFVLARHLNRLLAIEEPLWKPQAK